MEQLLVSRNDAAKMLSISVDTLDVIRHHGKVKSVKIGSRILIPVADLRSLVSKNGDIFSSCD